MTLIVNPQDAVTLNYLVTVNAQLTLALRGAGDLQSITTQSVSLQFVMDQKNIQLPAKLPYGIEPRIDALKYQCTDIANCGDK
jgi:pilus assembly protein CpaB